MIPPDDDWLLAGLTREPPVEHQRVASFPITLSQFFAPCFMITALKFSFVSFPHWVINSLDLKCGILSTLVWEFGDLWHVTRFKCSLSIAYFSPSSFWKNDSSQYLKICLELKKKKKTFLIFRRLIMILFWV